MMVSTSIRRGMQPGGHDVNSVQALPVRDPISLCPSKVLTSAANAPLVVRYEMKKHQIRSSAMSLNSFYYFSRL